MMKSLLSPLTDPSCQLVLEDPHFDPAGTRGLEYNNEKDQKPLEQLP